MSDEAERRTKQYMQEAFHEKKAQGQKDRRSIHDLVYEQYSNGNLQWLESHCRGVGFNMGCGRLCIADSIGVDISPILGTYKDIIYCDMNDVSQFKDEDVDYIISNYIGVIRCPVITFRDWWRILKPGGVIALICKNADCPYYASMNEGPLTTSKRGKTKVFTCYTPNTIRHYLFFAGFRNVVVEEHENELRVKGIKRD